MNRFFQYPKYVVPMAGALIGASIGTLLGVFVGVVVYSVTQPLFWFSGLALIFSILVLLTSAGWDLGGSRTSALVRFYVFLLGTTMLIPGTFGAILVLVIRAFLWPGIDFWYNAFYFAAVGLWIIPTFRAAFALIPDRWHSSSSVVVLGVVLLSGVVAVFASVSKHSFQFVTIWAIVGAGIGLLGGLVAWIIMRRQDRTPTYPPYYEHPFRPFLRPVLDDVSRKNEGLLEWIPLQQTFRFMYEPVTFDETSERDHEVLKKRFVGRDREIREITERILYSEGGAFLITGYRGVGKTSFVNRAVQQIKDDLHLFNKDSWRIQVLDIHLSLARSITPSDLMYYIIRNLYSKLQQEGIFDLLDKQTQDDLTLAYQRTSLSIKRSSSRSTEAGIGLSELALNLRALNVAPKVAASWKRTQVGAMDLSFMSYDDKSAEYDIILLSRRLVVRLFNF